MPLSLYFFILTLHVDTMSHWKVKMFPQFPNPKLMKFVFPHEIEKSQVIEIFCKRLKKNSI